MALPKIDTPTYELKLPVSKKKVKFRPFLVKEQKNLLMAMESDEAETTHTIIKDILNNCTLTDGVDLDTLEDMDPDSYEVEECKKLFEEANEIINELFNEDEE